MVPSRSMIAPCALAHVLFDHARAFDDDPLLFRHYLDDAATLAFLGPGDDHYLVVLLYMKSLHNADNR